MSSAIRVSRNAREETLYIWGMAWPIVLGLVGHMGTAVVDIAMVGRLGTEALAAVGFAATLVFTSQSFGAGLMAGVRILVAQGTGAGMHRQGIRAAW